MQKRRPQSASLPMTDADVNRINKGRSSIPGVTRKRKRSKNRIGIIFGYSLVVGLVVGGIYLGVSIVMEGAGSLRERTSRQVREDELALPLSQYSSLEYALKHSRLVGLYFAAAWCPVSTPITELIDEHLGDILLPPPSSNNPPPLERAPMSLVYVSSDRNEADFMNYPRRKWISVPYDSTERTALKKHFSTCSKPEVTSLGIDRKFEIPTLMILDGVTHGIITTAGAEDLEEYRENAFDHWNDLHDLIRAMEEKYGGDAHGSISSTKKHRFDQALTMSSLFA